MFNPNLQVLLLLVAAASCADQSAKKPNTPAGDKQPVKKSIADTSDLKTDSSYGLGYGLSYPYYGYGGLGSLGHGLGYGGYGYGGKGFVLPVYNYGQGGLGYGAYGGQKKTRLLFDIFKLFFFNNLLER